MIAKILAFIKTVSLKISDIQARILLSLIYILIMWLAAILARVFNIKFQKKPKNRKSNWHDWPTVGNFTPIIHKQK